MRLPEERKKGRAGKRRRDGGEDLLGGLDLGEGRGEGGYGYGGLRGKEGGGKRRREGEGKGERMGEAWEKRVGRGVGRKRR